MSDYVGNDLREHGYPGPHGYDSVQLADVDGRLSDETLLVWLDGEHERASRLSVEVIGNERRVYWNGVSDAFRQTVHVLDSLLGSSVNEAME